jgi:hypothetical protein
MHAWIMKRIRLVGTAALRMSVCIFFLFFFVMSKAKSVPVEYIHTFRRLNSCTT